MFCAQVAQLVEQGTENPCVGGSIPPLGTTHFIYLLFDTILKKSLKILNERYKFYIIRCEIMKFIKKLFKIELLYIIFPD